MTIIFGLAVLGLIATDIIHQVLSSRERERLSRMIKSRDLSEYVSVEPEEKEEKIVEETEVSIDDIPFLNEESRE